MDEHFIVNLRVANEIYPLRIKREDEEKYRKAASKIDYQLGQYKQNFTGDSVNTLQNSHYMAMTAIQAVADEVGLELQIREFEDCIEGYIKELDEYLKVNRG